MQGTPPADSHLYRVSQASGKDRLGQTGSGWFGAGEDGDEFQTSPGRGAYICPTEECLRQAIKKKQFSRAFRGSVDLSPIETAKAPWED